MIAYLCSRPELFAGSHAGNGEEIHIADKHDITEQGGLIGQNYLIGIRADFFYIDGTAHCDAETLSLSYGVVGNTLVLSEDISFFVHKVSGTGNCQKADAGSLPGSFGKALRVFLLRVILYEINIVAVCHKADFLRVGLMGYGETCLLRNPAHLVFGIFSQGHESDRKLFLCELIEHVGLVFGCIVGFFDGVSAVVQLQDMGIVAGSNKVRLHDLCGVEHPLPLKISVAFNAGIGGLASQIAFHKGIDDFLRKLGEAVEWIKADSQRIGNPARVINLAAPSFASVVGSPGAQRHTAHFISFLLQQIGCHGAVHTAGHADQYFLHLFISLFFLQKRSHTTVGKDSQAAGRTGESRVETMARQSGVRIVACVTVGQDHAVELKAFGVGEGDEKHPLFRETAAGADDRDRTSAQNFGAGRLYAFGRICGLDVLFAGSRGEVSPVFHELSEQGCCLFHIARAGADDGRETFLLLSALYSLKESFRILLLTAAGMEYRRVSGGLHGGDEDLLLRGQKSGKEGCDLG